MAPERLAEGPGGHEEKQIKEQNTDSMTETESTEPKGNKAVEKANYVVYLKLIIYCLSTILQ